MPPRHGGRFSLRLERREPDVGYALELETAAGSWQGHARVDAAGGVELGELSDAAPGWLVKAVHAELRRLWRAHPQAGWPRRVTRWREPPAGAVID